MRHVVLVVSVLAITGCSKKAERKPKPGATCPEAAENMLKTPLKAEGRDLSKLSDKRRAGLGRMVMAFADHCFTDHWSKDAIECLAGGETADQLGACKGTMTAEQEAATSHVVDDVESGSWTPKDPAYRAQIAKGEAQRDLEELVASFAVWKKKHPTTDCPAGTTKGEDDDLARRRGLQELHNTSLSGHMIAEDSWGHSYRLYCGDAVPAGASGFAASSDGPDGKPGTDDDLKSW